MSDSGTAYSKITCGHQTWFPLIDVFINDLWGEKSFRAFREGDVLITSMISAKLEQQQWL